VKYGDSLYDIATRRLYGYITTEYCFSNEQDILTKIYLEGVLFFSKYKITCNLSITSNLALKARTFSYIDDPRLYVFIANMTDTFKMIRSSISVSPR